MKKLHLLLVMFLFYTSVQAQITANFLVQSYNPCTANNAPITVDFLDLSISSNGAVNTWLWDFGDGNTSTAISPSHTYTFPGSYTICLTVENVNGQSDTECKTNYISYSNTPVCIIEPPAMLSCINPSVTLDGSLSTFGANITYEWRDANFQFLGNGPTLDVSTVGTYTLTVSEAINGCSAQSTITVEADVTFPIADAGPNVILTCANSSVILDGSGSSSGSNFIYTWNAPNGSVVANTLNVEVSQPGVYTLVVTDISNGCSSSSQVMVLSDFIQLASVTILDVSCYGNADGAIDMETIGGTPGYTILWSNNQTTEDIQNLAAGNYAVTITDFNGCELIENFTIEEPSEIIISDIVITNASCNGGLDGGIDITVTGGTSPYAYDWSNGMNTPAVVGVNIGSYMVTITDANGCTFTQSFVVEEPSELLISNASITNASCSGSLDGSIDITATGGTTPYSFFWSNGIGSEDVTNLESGTYTVTITDVNGCIAVSSDYIINDPTSIIHIISDTTICQGGTAELGVFWAPNIAYPVQWSPTIGLSNPNSAITDAMPTETTLYTAAVDIGTCVVEKEVLVTVNNYLDFGLLQFSNAPICEDDTLEFYANLGVQFNWTGPNGFSSSLENPIIPNADANNSGIYSLEITDSYGCTAAADTEVFIDDDCVYPGDTDTNMVVNHFDLLNIGLAFDSTGTPRQNASLNWMGQPSLDWSQSTPTSNVNFKHIDTDGNGVINSNDTLAITQNFGQTYNFNAQNTLNQFTDLPNSADGPLTIPFYVEPDTLLEGETVSLDIILGDVSNVVMGLYGIGFSLEYDSSIIVSGSAKIDFTNTWLGSVNADAISVQFDFPSPGRIDAAITRIDGMEMDGFGVFGNFIITLEDDILLWDPNSQWTENTNTVETEFSITNYHLINFSQEEIPVSGITTYSTIDETTSLNQVELDALIEVYPNPANELFFIASQNLEIEKIRIYSAAGELKKEAMKANNRMEFSTKEFSNGIYFIEIQTREGIVIKKLSVVK